MSRAYRQPRRGELVSPPMTEARTPAIGTWSGGRYLHFGEAIDEERLEALLRPGDGDRDRARRRRLRPGRGRLGCSGARSTARPARGFSLVGAIGHDFYEGERRDGVPKGFPRFTDPALRGPGEYVRLPAGWRPSARSSGSGPTRFDLLLLHNPDRTGFESEEVREGMRGLRDERGRRADRGRAGPRERLHARPDRLLRALRRRDRLGDGDPQSVRAVARGNRAWTPRARQDAR